MLRRTLLLASAAAIGIGALTQAARLPVRNPPPAMFLAPMIGVTEPCILLETRAQGATTDELAASCTGPDGSAAKLVEATLSSFLPAGEASRYPLGYTLNVPLLHLFRQRDDGWVIDAERVQRLVRTLRDVDRPAVLYLFSTHFTSGAPIEAALAADPTNLSQTPQGPLAQGSYYGSAIHNWSFATTETNITARRVEAIRAVVNEVCRLDARHIAKIRGVTLLGEVHHLFPDFESGMGFGTDYRVSDYSEASRQGFRAFLRERFGRIDAFNQAMGTAWTSFDQVDPPSKNIRSDRLRQFTEHIDSYAHGTLPIAGWVHAQDEARNGRTRISIYRNGELIGHARTGLGRQDVLEALPELGDANTGWRYDLDFRELPAGLHRIDVYLEGEQARRLHLATRQLAIMDRQQTAPVPLAQRPLPASDTPGPQVRFHVDLPPDLSSYFYNPLVVHWHAYRGRQVVDYLQFFNRVVRDSCLASTSRYTHQIIPFTNPGWDSNKFAIDASLQPLPDLHLGVSLYGEATYGASFARWLAGTAHRHYAVTEFHPLKAMGPVQVREMLDAHARRGARFVSFFLEPRFNGRLVDRGHNIFSFGPENPKFGSDGLYRSFAQAAVATPPSLSPAPIPQSGRSPLPAGQR